MMHRDLLLRLTGPEQSPKHPSSYSRARESIRGMTHKHRSHRAKRLLEPQHARSTESSCVAASGSGNGSRTGSGSVDTPRVASTGTLHRHLRCVVQARLSCSGPSPPAIAEPPRLVSIVWPFRAWPLALLTPRTQAPKAPLGNLPAAALTPFGEMLLPSRLVYSQKRPLTGWGDLDPVPDSRDTKEKLRGATPELHSPECSQGCF